jgi:hypothetical protein
MNNDSLISKLDLFSSVVSIRSEFFGHCNGWCVNKMLDLEGWLTLKKSDCEVASLIDVAMPFKGVRVMFIRS